MAAICPTITASDEAEYKRQIDNVKSFAKRIHIDLMDGELVPSVSLGVDKIWLPNNLSSDIHVMYKRPMDIIDRLLDLKPNLIVIHKEADIDHWRFADILHDHGIKTGLAIIPAVMLQSVIQLARTFDQILIFGGHLGYQGGQADLALLDKVKQARQLFPHKEIAWDGGINDQNIKLIAESGVGVLNVGAFIQKSPEPKAAYDKLLSSLN